MTLLFIPLSIMVLALIYAALSDASSMIISNKICLVVMAAFAMSVPLAWDGWAVFGEHMLVGLSFFVMGFILFAVGGLGGGDAKLMAAIGLFWTWGDALLFLVNVTIYGGALALVLLMARNYVPVNVSTNSFVVKMFANEKKIPYGIAITLGALTVLPTSDIVQRTLAG